MYAIRSYYVCFLLPRFDAAGQESLVTDAVRAAMARIDPARVWHHAAMLAGDDFEGRGTGSQGERRAAAYIRNNFV